MSRQAKKAYMQGIRDTLAMLGLAVFNAVIIVAYFAM